MYKINVNDGGRCFAKTQRNCLSLTASSMLTFDRWQYTAQILLDVFFSYNNRVFTLYSVYFSVTLKKSKQKKVKLKTFRYKYDDLRIFGPPFFFLTKVVYFECALIWNAQVNVNSCTVHYGSIQYTPLPPFNQSECLISSTRIIMVFKAQTL